MENVKSRLGGLTTRVGINAKDAMAAVTTGIANVPDGMASAVLAGINPVHGIYTLIIGTPIAALTVSTQLMMFNTTSAMTLVAVDGVGSRSGDDRVHAMIVIALLAGVVQIVLGALGLGMVTKFVPNSVMLGFLSGIATLIILGQLWDLTGYSDDLGGSRLQKSARLLANLRDIDVWTTAIGIGTLAIMVLLARGKLANFNLLIGLGAATAATWLITKVSNGADSVVLVDSLGDIPRSLPEFAIPKIGMAPDLLLAGVAVAVVGLLQAAGVAQAYPNPDGSPTSDSRDFLGQGIANTASSFFSSMAGGGSLSGTALLVSAGARTRLAAVMQAGVVLIVVLVFSGVLSLIPMTALAALLIYAASLSYKFDAIQAVRKTSTSSLVSMAATFLATLVVPLQQAVILGVVIAAVLFIYRSSADVRVKEITIRDQRIVFSEPSSQLRANSVTVLDVSGSLFYAGSRTLENLLPSAQGVERPVAILRLRGQRELGSTFFKVLTGYANDIREHGGRLILAGVEPEVTARLNRSGQELALGMENIFPAGSVLGDSVIESWRVGTDWLDAAERGSPDMVSSIQGIPASEQIGAHSLVETVPVRDTATEPPLPANKATSDESGLVQLIAPFLERHAPWAGGATWHAIALQAALMAAIGGVSVLFPEKMARLILPLSGGLLTAIGLFWIVLSIKNFGRSNGMRATMQAVSAGVAISAGLMVLTHRWNEEMTATIGWFIVSFAVMLLGVCGMVAAGALPEHAGGRKASFLLNAGVIALGLFGIASSPGGSDRIVRFGWLFLIGGIVLGLYAVALRRNTRTPIPEIGSTDVETRPGSDA